MIDIFTRSYIETALWSSNMDEYQIDDLAPETLKKMIKDCQVFQEKNVDAIDGLDEAAGHDFWLTRNGHGAGFWDGGWPEADGDILTKSSKNFGEVGLEIGDDGMIYIV